MVYGQWVLQALTNMIADNWADESVSRDLTTVSWQVHRIYGFSISSSSESSLDIPGDTLAVLRSLDDDDEDPDDVLDDVSGVHDDDVRWWLMMTTMMYDGWWFMMMMYDDDGSYDV